MSDELLRRWRELRAAARPGPYRFEYGNEMGVLDGAGHSLGGTADQPTYDLLELAPEVVDGLLAEVERLRAVLAGAYRQGCQGDAYDGIQAIGDALEEMGLLQDAAG